MFARDLQPHVLSLSLYLRRACLPPHPPLPPQHKNTASQTRLFWVTEERSFTAVGFMSRPVLSRQMCLLPPNLFLSDAPIILAYQSNLSQMLITTKLTLWLPGGSCDLNMRCGSCFSDLSSSQRAALICKCVQQRNAQKSDQIICSSTQDESVERLPLSKVYQEKQIKCLNVLIDSHEGEKNVFFL